MSKRKIIQIQIDPKGKIIALASDGSLWVKDNEWFRIVPLPDDSEEASQS